MNLLTKQFGVNIFNCAHAVKEAKAAGRFVNVMRPSMWGNPFVIGRDGTRTEVIEKYREHVLATPKLMAALPELRGKLLGCSCLPLPCHVDVLCELANGPFRRAADGDRRFQHCICFKCGLSALCTPDREFWDSPKILGHDALMCGTCFGELLASAGETNTTVVAHGASSREVAIATGSQKFVQSVETACRCCGKTVQVGYVGEEPCLLHPEPACERFLKYEPDDFLRWNRGATEN